jgi:hypothetical protein
MGFQRSKSEGHAFCRSPRNLGKLRKADLKRSVTRRMR